MANTYSPITNTTLSTTSSSVVLSGIPQTYTDLYLVVSAKTNFNNLTEGLQISFNSYGSNNVCYLQGYGNVAGGAYNFEDNNINQPAVNCIGGTSGTNTNAGNTWGYTEMYIGNYTSSTHKPFRFYTANAGVTSNFGTNAMGGGRTLITAAITALELRPNSGSNSFVAGSSFWLYGIKNT